MRALVLIGHGSSINDGARASVCRCVRAIAEQDLYDEVLCGMWKMEPRIATVLERCRAPEITVVPFFMSNGYYTRQVIPRELGLEGAVTQIGDRTIRYALPVGDHSGIAKIIVARAGEVLSEPEATLVVLGHGTRKNTDSEKTIYRQAERVRALGAYREVLTAFIDQEPDIRNIFSATASSKIIVVPLFAADGWHVTTTIPDDMAMSDGVIERGGRKLWYTRAVGSHPGIIRLVLETAARANAGD